MTKKDLEWTEALANHIERYFLTKQDEEYLWQFIDYKKQTNIEIDEEHKKQ